MTEAAQLVLNRRSYPVTALGPGVRAAIWVQGCGIGCAGCMSRDTWNPAAGQSVPVGEIVNWLAELPDVSGLTISGGEPFEQPEALAALLRAVRGWSGTRPEPVDVMVYSGFTTAALRRSPRRAAALELCDVAVTGPFRQQRMPGGRWRGSSNQRLELLSALGRARFGPDADSEPFRPALQAHVEGNRWWLVGVPGPGELERLEAGLAARGIELDQVSWRADS